MTKSSHELRRIRKEAVREYLAEIGAKGGKSRSNKKSDAARDNGRKGGRPRKDVYCLNTHGGKNTVAMKVFVSWSGDWSERVARELARCLEIVVRVKPWFSSDAIRSGSTWYNDIARGLRETKFGIVCLTPDNLEAPWLLFEAGALAKTSIDVESELTSRGPAAKDLPLSLFDW